MNNSIIPQCPSYQSGFVEAELPEIVSRLLRIAVRPISRTALAFGLGIYLIVLARSGAIALKAGRAVFCNRATVIEQAIQMTETGEVTQ